MMQLLWDCILENIEVLISFFFPFLGIERAVGELQLVFRINVFWTVLGDSAAGVRTARFISWAVYKSKWRGEF